MTRRDTGRDPGQDRGQRPPGRSCPPPAAASTRSRWGRAATDLDPLTDHPIGSSARAAAVAFLAERRHGLGVHWTDPL
ncbi:MAG: hypothetical protein ACRD0K_23365 [Egibacteraceae bacterium]